MTVHHASADRRGTPIARLQLRLLQREALRGLPAPRVAEPDGRLVAKFVDGIKSPRRHVT
ncbi:hypothetical protein ABZT02_04175 [Streptomyces sp. NPDC005402]|uniref:hypothetical protein n=1 Tax=Streptomyces sp. NPDC005402 TaxID=3155338 RepID=UPI0033A90C20